MAIGSVLAASGLLDPGSPAPTLSPTSTLSFALIVPATHSFAVLLPVQTLASNWFLKHRALAMGGVILTAGGLVGPLWLQLDAWLLREPLVANRLDADRGTLGHPRHHRRRERCVRDKPEDLGQFQDGAASEDDIRQVAAKMGAEYGGGWTAAEAMRTPQFYLMVLCGLGYAVPWYVLNAHGRLHLQDLGMSTPVAASILGAMALVSTFGRLGGVLADRIAPTTALGIALLIETVGSTLLLIARTQALAYAAVISPSASASV